MVGSCKKNKKYVTPDVEPQKEYDGRFSRMYSMTYFADSIPEVFIEWNEVHFPGPPGTFISIDSVTLNDTILGFQPDGFYRSYSTYKHPPFRWTVKGKNGIPSFTYKDTSSVPLFNGYNLLPDSSSLNNDLNIPITNMKDVSFITATLEDWNNHKLKKETKVSGSNTSITFSKQELSVFKHLSTSRLTLFMDRTPITTEIETKKFKFETSLEIIRDGVFY